MSIKKRRDSREKNKTTTRRVGRQVEGQEGGYIEFRFLDGEVGVDDGSRKMGSLTAGTPAEN